MVKYIGEQTGLFPCLPTTERGYGLIVDATPDGKGDSYMLYCNGSHVVIRSTKDAKDARIMSEHKGNATVAKFAPSGRWVASGDNQGKVIVWGFSNYFVKNNILVCQNVCDLAWSGDGKRLVAVGDGKERKARAFAWDTGSNIGEIGGHSKKILACDFRKDRPFRVVTASEDKSVNFFKGPPFKFENSFKGHTRYPNLVRYSPKGEYYLTCGSDSKLVLFEGKTGAKVKEIDCGDAGHKSNIYSFAWSPCGTKILTCSADKTARIITIPDGKVERVYKMGDSVPDQQVSAVWRKEFMATVSLSGSINFLEPENDQISRKFHGHQDYPKDLEVDSENGMIYSCDTGGKVLAWEEKTGECTPFAGTGHGKTVAMIALNSDKSCLISVGFDDTVRFNSTKDNTFSEIGHKLPSQARGLAASKKTPGRCYVVCKNHLVVIDGEETSTTELDFDADCVDCAVGDAEIVVGGFHAKKKVGKVVRYTFEGNSNSPSESGEYTGHKHPVKKVSYSSNGKQLASTDTDRYIYMWDVGKTKKPNNSGWRYHQAACSGLQWSPAGTQLVTCSADENIIAWPKAGKLVAKRAKMSNAHHGGVVAVQFIDETRLVSVGMDKCLKFWQVKEDK